jgi:hypothetical protein
MKKLMVLIMVVSTCASAKAGLSLSPNDNPAVENVFLTEAPAVTICIQADDCVVYSVFIEPSNDKGQLGVHREPIYTSIAHLLPEPVTVAALGIAGLLIQRRKVTIR